MGSKKARIASRDVRVGAGPKTVEFIGLKVKKVAETGVKSGYYFQTPNYKNQKL